MLLLAGLGWGLLAIGAATHLSHRSRLRELLALHFDRERPIAAALTAAEVGLAVLLPLGWFIDARWLPIVAALAGTLGVGFAAWIVRLLATGSDLPCACSFSAAPTGPWSLVRALLVILAVGFAAGPGSATAIELATALAAGAAVAAAVYVLPEALAWPDVARAQLVRIDTYSQDTTFWARFWSPQHPNRTQNEPNKPGAGHLARRSRR